MSVRQMEILRKARLRLAYTDTFALVAAVFLVAKLLLARHYILGSAFGPGAVADAAVIVAILSACALAGRRTRRVLITVVAVIIPLFMLVGIVHASYFNELPTAGMLSVSPQLASTSEGTSKLLVWQYLLFVVDWPLLFFGPSRRSLFPPASRRRNIAVATLYLTIGAVFAVAATVLAKPLYVADCSRRFGVFAYQVAAVMQGPAISSADAADAADKIQARIDRLTGHSSSAGRRAGAPAAGSMKGKNLIVIQMESMQTALIGARIGTQPVVPNLEKLVKQSVYFPNAYSQIGRGNTSDAEFVTNTSLYPCLEEPSAVAYADKELPALPRLLDKQGYSTITMHTNEATFWNRDHLYPALGFETIYDQGYFGVEEWAGFGASDAVLYDRGLAVLVAAAAGQRPFYAQLVTVSAHYPFTRTGGKPKLRVPDDMADTETGRYLQAQSYADAALGKFIKKLKKTGLLEKSVIVVYGDHFGMRLDTSETDWELRKELFGHAYNPADFYNVPLLIRLPGGEPSLDESVVGQIDIMPTMADLFGIDLSEVPHFGKSAFVESPTLLTRASSVETYIDDDIAFFRGVTKGDGAYSPSTHLKLKGAKEPERLDNARRIVELSEQYARGLPEREDATDTVGYIPATAKEIEKTPYR